MIRDVTEHDAQAIAHIYNHFITNTVVTFEYEPVTSVIVLQRINKVRNDKLFWLVAEENAQVAGYAYASSWHTRSAYSNTVEVSVYLSPKSSGRGIGTALYHEVFRRLSNLNKHAIIAAIALPNTASVALHEKFGMKKVGHFSEVGFKHNQWIDVGYWQKNL